MTFWMHRVFSSLYDIQLIVTRSLRSAELLITFLSKFLSESIFSEEQTHHQVITQAICGKGKKEHVWQALILI